MKNKKKRTIETSAGGLSRNPAEHFPGGAIPGSTIEENRARAFRVAEIETEYFRSKVCDTKESFVTDLLTDIRHYCDVNGLNFETQARMALSHYQAEAAHTDPQCSKAYFVAGGRDERTCGEPAAVVCSRCEKGFCAEHLEEEAVYKIADQPVCENCLEAFELTDDTERY